MAKNDWRDSGKPKQTRQERQAAKSTVAGDGRAKSTVGARIQQFIWLLGTAALLAFLIRMFVPLIVPPKKTPFILITNQKPDTFLSNTPFHNESIGLFGAELNDLANQEGSAQIANLAFQETSFNGLSELDLVARGPDRNLALFYLFAEQFVDSKGQALLVGNDAKDSNENMSLESLLRNICKLDLKSENVNRIVFLDSGRLNTVTSGLILPGDFASKADQILRTLRSENVENADRLWIYLAHNDYQRAWTSPELNSSVFGFFVALGLEGYADENNDWVVTLAELKRYVDISVTHWAANYRDSVQTPLLLGATAENKAEDLRVIHCVPPDKTRTADNLATDKADHEAFWAKAYQLQTPHAKHKIYGRLARLESLRYSKCSEYGYQTTRVRELIASAESPGPVERISNSLFDQPYKVAPATVETAIQELVSFMKPPVQTDPDSPPKKPELGAQLLEMAAVPQQRAQVLWEFLLEKENLERWFHSAKFTEAVSLFDGRALCKSVVQPDELQFLVALDIGVPWTRAGFKMETVSGAISARHAGNKLVRGILPIPNSSLDDFCPGYEREWRLVETELEQIDSRRRNADDRLFAGQFEGLVGDYQGIVDAYNFLATKLRLYVEARQSAEDSLIMVPYLKAYAANDAVCRPNRVGDGTDKFLEAITSIQKNAELVLGYLNTNELRDLELTYEKLSVASNVVVDHLAGVVGTAEQQQSGALYVFEAMQLLETPLIEWIDTKLQKEGSLRAKIARNVAEALRDQQSACFSTLTDFGNKEESIQDLSGSSGEVYLKMKTWLSNSWPKSDVQWADEYVGSWDQLQSKRNDVPDSYKSLRKPNQSFDGIAQVRSEIDQLENHRLQLERGGQILAFGSATTDMTNQRNWLQRYLFEMEMASRSFADLLGNDKVQAGRPIPFVRYAEDFLENAKRNARELANARLGEELFQPYDSNSLPTLADNMKKSVAEVSKAFLSASPQVRLNGKRVVERTENFDPRTPNEVENDMEGLRTALAENKWVGGQFSESPWLAQSRWMVDGNERFADSWKVPANRTTPLETELTQVFRGHVFDQTMNLNPLKPEVVRISELQFSPKVTLPTRSQVTVRNDAVTEVDLYFLIDCSVSMREPNGDERINRLVRTAVTNTIKELAKTERFHIGIAAFGSQSRFKKGDLVNLKQPIEGPLHPMLDFRIGIEADADSVSTSNNVDAELRYVEELKAKSQITNLYYSIKKLVRHMDQQKTNRKKVLLVLTDGEDTQQFFPNGEPYTNDYFPNVGFEPTTLSELVEFRKVSNDVQILMIQTNTDFAKQRQQQERKFQPAGIRWVGLKDNPKLELQNHIFNAVKRQLYALNRFGASTGRFQVDRTHDRHRCRKAERVYG